MKFKNWLIKEEYLKTGSAIIYHRTEEQALSGIIATGFQAGAGDMYGKGFYATLDLESQNIDTMISTYGDVLTKWFIPHLNHFVIFNPILANMVHGTSSIEEQLKKIVGENLPQLDKEILKSHEYGRTSDNAFQFSKEYLQKLNPQQKEKIAGLIFNGGQDGNVFVAYNNNEIVFNGFVYVPNVMNSDQMNQLKTGHGWQSRVGTERIKDVYKLSKGDKRSEIANQADSSFNTSDAKLNANLIEKYNNRLNIAAKNGNLDLAKHSVEKGANKKNDAINIAAKNGHLNIIEFLASPNSDILNIAAKNGNLNLVKYLIDEKGETNLNQAIMTTVKNGYLDIVKFLVEKGAKVTPLLKLAAARSGHPKIVQYLHKLVTGNGQSLTG